MFVAAQELSPVIDAIPSQSLACGVMNMRALWLTHPPSVPARGYKIPRGVAPDGGLGPTW